MKIVSGYLIHFLCRNRENSIRRLLQFLLICGAISPIQKGNAQISHGGRPLAQGVEKTSRLHAAVDYFVDMPAFDADSALYVDNLPGNRVGGLKFAHKFFVNLSPVNSGIVFHTEDGTKVWKIGIRSSGAHSINVLFNQFNIPDGAQLFLYNSDRSSVLGAFTRENRPAGGEFSIAPVAGDELTIEYHEPANAAFSGELCITEVNHDYRGLFRSGTNPSPENFPCIPDLSCNSQYDTIGRSVCLLIINGNTYCTGTFVNNTAQDGKPYLLTASHCLSNNADLGSRMVAFLNYGCPRCDPRIRGSEEFSISGSITRALSNEVDFALVEFTEVPPSDYRPYLAGWSRDTIPSTALPFTCIHHPNGGWKKYCEEEDSVTTIDWTSGKGIEKGNHWNIKKWEIGHTWTGSSGSGLFDKYNRIRGGLSGGDSGGKYGCGSYTSGDYFFRFDKAWNSFSTNSRQLKHWLDPLTPDSVQSPMQMDGLDPHAYNPAQRINNLEKTDSLGIIRLDKPNWGYLSGHNSYGTTDFAEHFTTSDSSMIHGVYIIAAKGHNSSTFPITVRVFKGGDLPGAILGKAILNPNYQDYVNGDFVEKTKTYFTNKENYLRFDAPISVGTDFYVGYDITYPITEISDTFAVYAAIRETSQNNTAYYKKSGKWFPNTVHTSLPTHTSLWLEPVISGDTITTPNSYTEIDKDSLLFERPVVSFSHSESSLYIALPVLWAGDTKVDVFDLSGRIVQTSTISPPLGKIHVSLPSGIYILRLRNNQLVYVLKTIIGNP